MKCPCCKVINTLDEAWKHRSLTSVQASLRAWDDFVKMDKAEFMLAILPCPKHGNEEGFSSFINEANAKKHALADRVKAEREKLTAEALKRMLRDSALSFYRGLLK